MQDDKRDDDSANPWRDDPGPDDAWPDGENSAPGRDDDLPSFSYRDEDEEPDPRERPRDEYRRDDSESDDDSGEAVDIWGEPLGEDGSGDSRDDAYPVDDSRESWDTDRSSEDAFENDADDYDDTVAAGTPAGADYRDSPEGAGLPLGLIVVAVVALILLAAGGYGVMQQRSAMQTQIEDLQARLANTANPEEVSAARRALDDMREENTEMRTLMTSLREENQRLSDTLAGLEQQLDAQRETTEKGRETAASASPAPDREPAPTSPAPAGDWFVNFGAYGQESLANEWAQRLREDIDTVAVMTVDADGRTLYRVRVTGLASKSAARSLAASLEKRFELDPLWVGKE